MAEMRSSARLGSMDFG